MSLSFTSLQNHHGAADYSRSSGTRRFSWGIFEVVYDHPTRTFTLLSGLLIYKNFQSTMRFFRELSTIAPAAFAIHVLGCIWMSVSPALICYPRYDQCISFLTLLSLFIHKHHSDPNISQCTSSKPLRWTRFAGLPRPLAVLSSSINTCGSHYVSLFS